MNLNELLVVAVSAGVGALVMFVLVAIGIVKTGK